MTDDEKANDRVPDNNRQRGLSSVGIVFFIVGFVFWLTLDNIGVAVAFVAIGITFLATGIGGAAKRKG